MSLESLALISDDCGYVMACGKMHYTIMDHLRMDDSNERLRRAIDLMKTNISLRDDMIKELNGTIRHLRRDNKRLVRQVGRLQAEMRDNRYMNE